MLVVEAEHQQHAETADLFVDLPVLRLLDRLFVEGVLEEAEGE